MIDTGWFVSECFKALDELSASPQNTFIKWRLKEGGDLVLGRWAIARIFYPHNPCELIVYNKNVSSDAKKQDLSKDYVKRQMRGDTKLERCKFTPLTIRFDFGDVTIECPKYIVVCVVCSLVDTEGLGFSYFTNIISKAPVVVFLKGSEPTGFVSGWYE